MMTKTTPQALRSQLISQLEEEQWVVYWFQGTLWQGILVLEALNIWFSHCCLLLLSFSCFSDSHAVLLSLWLYRFVWLQCFPLECSWTMWPDNSGQSCSELDALGFIVFHVLVDWRVLWMMTKTTRQALCSQLISWLEEEWSVVIYQLQGTLWQGILVLEVLNIWFWHCILLLLSFSRFCDSHIVLLSLWLYRFVWLQCFQLECWWTTWPDNSR